MNKEEYCEKVQLSAMVILDGEIPPLSVKELDEHLKSCADCRRELEQQKVVIGLLEEQSRRLITEDVCSRVAATIEESRVKLNSRQGLGLFIVLGLILLAYKIIEVLPNFTTGLVIKMIPIVSVFVFFLLLKQNTFKVNKNLKLHGNMK